MSFINIMAYEWGVAHKDWTEEMGPPHRDGWDDESYASEWIAEWVEMGGNADTFKIICRPVGEWMEWK